MRHPSIVAAAIAATAALALAGCGPAKDSGKESAAGSKSSAASPSAAATSAKPTTTAAKWCKAFTKEPPKLSDNPTATQAADTMTSWINDMKKLGYPADMPQNAQDALAKQYDDMLKVLKKMRRFGSERVNDLRTDPDKKDEWKKLGEEASVDTPKSVSNYMDSHCS